MYWVADTFHDFLKMLKPEFVSATESTPLYLTIEYNDSETVRQYLANAAPIESRNDRGWTLLIGAAHYGYPRRETSAGTHAPIRTLTTRARPHCITLRSRRSIASSSCSPPAPTSKPATTKDTASSATGTTSPINTSASTVKE